MVAFLCSLWPLLAAGLIGWLASGLLGRMLRRGDTQSVALLESKEVELTRLRADLDGLRKRVPAERVVEKIVDRPVDRVVENVVEKIVEKPVDRVVEKVVEKMVDNPVHLQRIRALESEVGLIVGLRSQISQLQSAPPRVVERVVEKLVEKQVVDTRALEDRDRQINDWRTRFADLEQRLQSANQTIVARSAELRRWMDGPIIDVAAAKEAGFVTLKGPDDLEVIEGIGPKIRELLNQAGVYRFMELAQMSAAQIQAILDDGGPHFTLAHPDTWPEQAELAARNRWRALKSLQDVLNAGNRREGK